MEGDEDEFVAEALTTDRIRAILSDLEEADFERLDPPTDVWEGIEASITPSPDPLRRKPPSHRSSTSTVVEYVIDANDVVIGVGRGWADFARANDAHELVVPPSDRALWTYFASDETRELWQLLVERVRALQQGAEVPLRCDAPDARRWFEMSITPESDGQVRFRCVLIFEESRPSVSLLDSNSERDTALQPVALCSWCGRAQHGSRWLHVEALVQAARLLEHSSMPPISYGICSSCRDEMSAELLVPVGVEETT